MGSFRDLLCCPTCQGPLAFPSDLHEDAPIRCGGCRATYPVTRGIPRFVDTDGYTRSFSFEWSLHRRTQLDSSEANESERALREKTGLDPPDVKEKMVLDVGCGTGRFAEVISRWGGHVVAFDLSYAVEAAQENLRGRKNVLVVQADVFRMPFPAQSFDLIYSLGVLHHTPDCERAFRRLPSLLKPGGTIAVWLYEPPRPWHEVADFYRRFTTRMPPAALYALCHMAVPLYYLLRIPFLGRALRQLAPISMHPRASWRILDTFDWYSPRYQSKHTYPEVYRWFASEGLTEIQLLDFSVAIRAKKPKR